MKIAWVIGSRGLLGSALSRALIKTGTGIFSPIKHFKWHSESELAEQLKASVPDFVSAVEHASHWEVYWAAGKGSMGSTEAELMPETRVLSLFIQLLKSDSKLISKPGSFAFASSAGGIYAKSLDYFISENSFLSPTTAYAREKLRQEELLQRFAGPGRTVLLARLSTMYGPGQAFGKKQGLITHIARCIVRNQPVQIFVPFDTIRDYISADDAAFEIIESLRLQGRQGECVCKIIASEQPTTIAQIISTFKVITRRPPRIVTSANALGSLYTHCVRFKSVVEPCRKTYVKTNLVVGIAQVIAHERNLMAQTKDSG